MLLKADTVTKDYVKDAGVFADIFNYYIYGGRQVILPEQLTERDSTKIALPYGADGAVVPVQKFRDVQKLYAAMTDGKMEYVLYGAENQAEIHYAMAVKINLYDALEYVGQVEEAAKSHRKEMKRKKEQGETPAGEDRKTPGAGEFLSGFWAEDRLIPSITVTIFFGSEEWDGPLSLFDMMDVSEPEVLACMDNYHVRLIAPAQMADEEIMKFQSSLREVMLFIKYSKEGKVAVNSQVIKEEGEKARDEQEYNQLLVPPGKRARIELSDGTRLVVNSQSKVVYPRRFKGDIRKIYAQGEVFLEVAHDKKHPFIVESDGFNLRVLGTKFSISKCAS